MRWGCDAATFPRDVAFGPIFYPPAFDMIGVSQPLWQDVADFRTAALVLRDTTETSYNSRRCHSIPSKHIGERAKTRLYGARWLPALPVANLPHSKG
jgi:hypothetical protein